MDLASIVSQHFGELSLKYQGLHLAQQGDGSWSVAGLLSFSAHYQDQQIDDEYEIEALIPPGYPVSTPQLGKRVTGYRWIFTTQAKIYA